MSGPPEPELLLFDQALASTSCGVVLADAQSPDLPLVYVNPAFVEITGYSTTEVLGRNCRFLQGEDHDQPAIEEIRQALRARRHCEVVLRNYRKNGEMFWNELTLSPMLTAGELTHFVGIQNDVSAREQARQERTLLIRELETAQREFERYTRMVAEHLSGPFGNLRQLCDELLDKPAVGKNSTLDPLLSEISQRTFTLESLADRLLEYTSIRPTRAGFERVRISELVAEIVASLELPSTVEVNFAQPSAFVYSRRDRLRQIFLALIDNAARHRDKHKVSITIGFQESGDVVRFWVSDDGPGISGPDQRRIFDLFERGSRVVAEDSELPEFPSGIDQPSMGLGLSLAKRAVESLGGRIWVGSVPRHGAVFFFELPR